MKKEYMKPEMLVVELQQHCQILAGSVQSLGGTNPEGFILDPDLEDEDILR